MAPHAVFVAEHGQIDPGSDRMETNGSYAVDDQQHAVNVDLDRREREDLAEFDRVDRQHCDRKHPEPLYETIRLYRHAFTHDPVLGRAIVHGRELLPPQERLPKRRPKQKDEKPLLWRHIAQIPAGDMIDGFELQERLWRHLSAFLQEQWASLTLAFMQARQCDKFLADLGLTPLLPIREMSRTLFTAGTAAVSGATTSNASNETYVVAGSWHSPSSGGP